MSYPGFAELFHALLQANGISARQFAQRYSATTGRYISSVAVDSIRSGDTRPTYQFVVDIADHNLLSADPERMRPNRGSLPGGEHRIALFSAAGLIEVTPSSIQQWNQEVIAGWQRRVEQHSAQQAVSWKELMKKLLSFHTQGERCSTDSIVEAANNSANLKRQLDHSRFHHLLSGLAVPTSEERLALGKAAALDVSQATLIETALEDGTLPIASRPLESPFSVLLTEMLDLLRAHGISQRQLIQRAISPGATEPDLSPSGLSAWKTGRNRPTMATLRALVAAVERCHDQANRPIVPHEEIQKLVSTAGFSLDELAATTHSIVAHINKETRIKPLLSAIRNAADLSVPAPAVDSPEARAGLNPDAASLTRRVEQWENEGCAASVTQADVRDLLARYNRLLQSKGQVELSPEEIQKVVDVSQRDREEGLRDSFRKRAQAFRPPPTARHKIGPDIG